MRLRNKPYAWDKIKEHGDIVIESPQLHKGNWSNLFGNEQPIHVEIGTGRGDFIIGMAKKYPKVNFIGIEKFTSVIIDVLEKILEEDLPNVRLLNVDATGIKTFFGKGEISNIYLNFSDPWPKVRHHKRRLTHENFLKQYVEIMKKDAEIHMKTDNQTLFEFSLESISNFGLGIKNISLDLHKSDFTENVRTEYEEKFSQKGNRIYRLEGFMRQ